MLKFPSMEELFEFKRIANLVGINSLHEHESTSLKGLLKEADLELAINAFQAIKIKALN